MLFRQDALDGVRSGAVTLAFPTVAADASAVDALRARLRRLDASAAGGAWTARTMAVLQAHPAVRAGDLCVLVGQEKQAFKRNVRKLKNLGLTESLGTGYRLSPRGRRCWRPRARNPWHR